MISIVIIIIYKPYTRLDTKNPDPKSRYFACFVTIVVQHTLAKQTSLSSLNFYYKTLLQIKLSKQRPLSWCIIPLLGPYSLISVTYPKLNCMETMPFTAANTITVYIWEYPYTPDDTSRKVLQSFFGMISHLELNFRCDFASLF